MTCREGALEREKSRSELSGVSVATVYAYRGEIDQAFRWLDKAVNARDGALGHKLEHEPLLAPLRSDPRYLRLLHEADRPQEAQANRRDTTIQVLPRPRTAPSMASV